MIVFIFLCTIIFQAHAANEVSDLATVGDFINRLHVEKEKDNSKNFIFTPIDKEDYHAESLTCDCDEFKKTIGNFFGEYLISLASSTFFSDEEKLKKEFVHISPLMKLSQEDKDEKYKKFLRGVRLNGEELYPIGRLWCANVLNINGKDTPSNVSYELLSRAALHSDASLYELILKQGIRPDMSLEKISALSYCQTEKIGRLAVEYNARLNSAYVRKEGLMSWFCRDVSTTESNKLLRFYLSEKLVKLDYSNQQGSLLIESTLDNYLLKDATAIERVDILLRYGCEYTEELKMKVCEQIGKKSADAKKKIELVFEKHENI